MDYCIRLKLMQNIQQPKCAQDICVHCIFRRIEAGTRIRLRRKMKNIIRFYLANHLYQRGVIIKVSIVEVNAIATICATN